MERSRQHEALVLKLTPFGESHATAHLLTAEGTMLRAAVYGVRSARGSLRGKVEPFARGTAYLYYNPPKDAYKVLDFDVIDYHLGVRADLGAMYAANLFAEIVLTSYASGDEPAVFALIAEAFTAADRLGAGAVQPGAPPREHGAGNKPGAGNDPGAGNKPGAGNDPGAENRPGAGTDRAAAPAHASTGADSGTPRAGLGGLVVQVVWRYLALMGVQPDPTWCAHGERNFREDEVRYYSRGEGHFVAREWAHETMPVVSPEAAAFLTVGATRTLLEASTLPLCREALGAARTFVLTAVQDQLHVPLKTIRSFASSGARQAGSTRQG